MEPDQSGRDAFKKLIESAKTVQSVLLFLPTVAVGGTASALYARHRVSLDVDFVSPMMRERFDEVESVLRDLPGFSIARIRRPVLILGKLGDDEIGIRQLRRQEPLDSVDIDGLHVPSLAEMIRVKSFVLSDRRAVRDFIDLAALIDTAGWDNALKAMLPFEKLYQGLTQAGPVVAFAEAAFDDPSDIDRVDTKTWRFLDFKYQDIVAVQNSVRKFALAVIEQSAAP